MTTNITVCMALKGTSILSFQYLCCGHSNVLTDILMRAQVHGYVFTHVLWNRGTAVAQLVEALRYKSEGRGFDSRWCH